MARKVLISFLGTGPFESKETRTYKTARYHLGEADLGDYPFVSAALKEYYQIDKVILIGTVHSMWEEVYRWFNVKAGKSEDETIYFDIAEACEKANHLSELVVPHQEAIEQSIGNDSKMVLIKYGITEQEIRENTNIILGIQKYLNNHDELIVDVTHSFRSLPLFIMNLLIYLKNVSQKDITISHIHYGMLEMSKELGFAPIIDLKATMDVNDWITGAYSFVEFGNAYKISKLIAQEDKGVSTLLNDFSNTMNLNHLFAIQGISQRLSSIKEKKYATVLPELIINPIVGEYIKYFPVNEKKHSVFQLKLAKWQLEHKKYAQALLTINESIITYICESQKLDWDDFDNREGVKGILKGYDAESRSMVDPDLRKVYKQLLPLRNCTAHTMETSKNIQDIIKTLKESMSILETIIK